MRSPPALPDGALGVLFGSARDKEENNPQEAIRQYRAYETDSKYRPHRSLGNITPRRFAQNINTEGSGSIRATPSLRPSLDFLYQLNFNINLSRLTLPVDQFA